MPAAEKFLLYWLADFLIDSIFDLVLYFFKYTKYKGIKDQRKLMFILIGKQQSPYYLFAK